MGWNGTGQVIRGNGVAEGSTLWHQTFVLGRDILTDDHDNHDQDLADAIEHCLTKDGQNAPLANLPMNGKKHTGVGNATSDSEYVAYGQIKALLAAFEALSFSNPLDWNVSEKPNATIAVSGDIDTLNLANAVDGRRYSLLIVMDATGGHDFAFPSGWRWPGGSAWEIAPGANAWTLVCIRKIGATIYVEDFLRSDRNPWDPEPFQALTFAAALAWNAGEKPNATVTVTADITGITLSGTEDGGVYNLVFKQDPTGGHSVAFPAAWKGPSDDVADGPNEETWLTVRNRGGTIYAAPLLTDLP